MNYNRNLDTYITNRALELTGSLSESEIAKIISEETGLDVSRNVVHGRVYRNKISSGLEKKPRTIMPYFDKYREYFTEDMLPAPKVDYDFSEGPIKILVLNDLHTPMQHERALEQAITENKSADIVITSEVSDMYSLTSFAKYQHVSFELEVEEIIRWFEFLNETFPVTYVINSGHDRRLTRYVLSRIRSDLLFLIEPNLLRVLARPFAKIITIQNNFHFINDAIFTHFDKSSSVPMRSALNAHQWLQNWKSHLTTVTDYRVLVQAHSHFSGILNYSGIQLIESGCLQEIPEWVLRKLPMKAWTHGWVLVFQHNGVTNLNATQLMVYHE